MKYLGLVSSILLTVVMVGGIIGLGIFYGTHNQACKEAYNEPDAYYDDGVCYTKITVKLSPGDQK